MKNYRKGIILAGGSGSRLYPCTKAISKHLIPVYDKPMIYYSLSTLMLSGIREVLLISTPQDINLYKQLLSDGSQFGISLEYAVQENPNGVAEAILIGKSFIGNSECALILGDNIFFGHDLEKIFTEASQDKKNTTLFAYHVSDPERFGVVEFNKKKVVSIEEKPEKPKSNYALTGLYFYDNHAAYHAESLKKSKRGELEITDLNKIYLREGNLNIKTLGRGHSWFDAGNPVALLEASNYVYTIEKRQGLKISCPEEIAYRKGWISREVLDRTVFDIKTNDYLLYLKNI